MICFGTWLIYPFPSFTIRISSSISSSVSFSSRTKNFNKEELEPPKKLSFTSDMIRRVYSSFVING